MKELFNDLKKKPFVVYGIIIVCLFLYLCMILAGGSTNSLVLLNFGARSNLHIVAGQWWRLLSAAFLHAGLMHLAMNLIFIYYGGSQIEMMIGHWRFFVIYFVSALGGNLLSFALSPALSVGASTAIAGMLASVIVLEKFYPYHTYLKYLAKNYTLLVIINVIFAFFSTTIDHAGHLGGFISGALITTILPLPRARNHKPIYRILALIALIVLWAFCLYYGYHKTWSLRYIF